jgi:hypothetical protein
MLCLNRGEIDTGPAWFKTEIDAVAAAVRREQRGGEGSCPKDVGESDSDGEKVNGDEIAAKPEPSPEQDTPEKDVSEQEAKPAEPEGKPAKLDRLPIDVWWGGLDGMVPRNGQGEL